MATLAERQWMFYPKEVTHQLHATGAIYMRNTMCAQTAEATAVISTSLQITYHTN